LTWPEQGAYDGPVSIETSWSPFIDVTGAILLLLIGKVVKPLKLTAFSHGAG
jgi:hypothetical protein